MFLVHLAGACRLRVTGRLVRLYPTPEDAEKYFFGMAIDPPTPERTSSPQLPENLISTAVQTDKEELPVVLSEVIDIIRLHLERLPVSEQLDALAELFRLHGEAHYDVSIPQDMLVMTLIATKRLKSCHQSNVVYGIAKAAGQMREGGGDSRLPAKRMPMGLIEYTTNFFNADSHQQVSY